MCFVGDGRTMTIATRPPASPSSLLYVHLTDGSRNFSPDVVDILIQPLQSKDLERVIRFGQETDKAAC